MCKSKKTSKLRVIGLSAGNSPVTGEFPVQKTSYAENASIWWRHHGTCLLLSTHWGRVTHICVGNLTIISSDNGLSPGRRQAIIGTNAGILLIGNLRKKLQWNLNRNSYIIIQENALEKVVCKMAAILSRPQCVQLGSWQHCHRDDLHFHSDIFFQRRIWQLIGHWIFALET